MLTILFDNLYNNEKKVVNIQYVIILSIQIWIPNHEFGFTDTQWIYNTIYTIITELISTKKKQKQL